MYKHVYFISLFLFVFTKLLFGEINSPHKLGKAQWALIVLMEQMPELQPDQQIVLLSSSSSGYKGNSLGCFVESIFNILVVSTSSYTNCLWQ